MIFFRRKIIGLARITLSVLMKIIMTGGGSGGHVMPALSLIDKLKTDNDILYVGSKNSIEQQQCERRNIEFRKIATGKLRRYLSLKNVTDIFRVIKGIFDAGRIIRKFRPNVIVSTGGFVSVPVVIAGHFHSVPILIHEQTIDAGLANKIAAKFATRIAVTFSESKKYFPAAKTVQTGIPLRDVIFTGSRDSAIANLGLNSTMRTIYFTGGGLGCHILNETALQILDTILDTHNVIYQTGNAMDGADYEAMVQFREGLSTDKQQRFKLYNFVNEEIADIFAAADMAVARSGAGTVCELSAMHIPAVFIPLAIATGNEQYKNAKSVSDIGGAVILEEKDLTADKLLSDILCVSDKCETMRNALSLAENKNGSEMIIEIIKDIAK